MLVVARQRCNEGGAPSRLMINTYLPPSEPLVGTSPLPASAVIRNALAVQERLSRLPVGPSFHCLILLDMSPSSTPGRSAVAYIQFLRR
jgi:hypothetical protein